MITDGVRNYRYELVEGNIIDKTSQSLRHRAAISRLTAWFFSVFGIEYVQSQAEIDVSLEDNPTSEPQPDVAALTDSLPQLTKINPKQNPRPEQIRLLVEVADTTLNYDLFVKAGLYARARIAEYWVLDLNARQLHILRQPANGAYQQTTTHPETASVAPLSAPAGFVTVARLLP